MSERMIVMTGIETRCIQAGYIPGNGEPRQIPIIQSTTFKYDTSEDMGKLFDLEASGYFYSRLQNPTCDLVAAKICSLEGGSAAMLTSSGQAANFYAVFNIANAGDHVVASSAIYGGTYNLFAVTMKKMGISFTFVPPDCTEEALNAAFQPNTKAVFGETIANPALCVLDIEMFARAAHAHGVPLIVDNTFATPINCRPFEWGADIVTHSTTKYMDGHGSAVGGCIVDSGRFDWTREPDKFPGLTTPDESYHGIIYTERFGLGGAFITKATAQLMRDFGSVQSPQSAFLLNLGLESLPVRMQRHCENAQAVAEFLQGHEQVAWVRYCGLPGDPYYDRARKYLPNGSCGVVSFGVRGGRKAAEAFMKALKIAAIETHVADARTCCLHPASATHRQMNDEELRAAGVSPDLVRLSVGLESVGDLIADLDQALRSV
jgi:O-acetylhomoserine (thiol)-lyase